MKLTAYTQDQVDAALSHINHMTGLENVSLQGGIAPDEYGQLQGNVGLSCEWTSSNQMWDAYSQFISQLLIQNDAAKQGGIIQIFGDAFMNLNEFLTNHLGLRKEINDYYFGFKRSVVYTTGP